ncbi:hypothetical protein ACWIB8_05130 [Corynebacterium flavescens]
MAVYSAGSASIAIRPDLRNFRRKLEGTLKAMDVDYGVEVNPDMDGFKQKLEAYLNTSQNAVDVSVRADTSQAMAEIARVSRDQSMTVDVDVDTAAASAQVAALKAQTDGVGRSLSMVGLYAGAIGGIGALASGSVAPVASLATGLVSMSGALLTLPAAAVAAGAGLAAVVTGSLGLSDAFSEMNGDAEKFEQALSELAPTAAEFVRSIKEVSSEWSDMQETVQDSLFTGLGDSVREFTSSQLPVLESGLSGINAEINTGLRASISQFSSEAAALDFSTFLDNSARSASGLSLAAAPLSQIFIDLATVGSEYLPEMAQSFGLATQRWSEMLSTARESGRLNEIIESGMSATGAMVDGLSDAGGILTGVFRAADEVGQPMISTLGTVLDLTHQWVDSTKGQESLVQFFTTTSAAVSDLAPSLGTVAEVLVGDLIPGVAGFISGAGPGLNDFVTGLADGLDGAVPALSSLGQGVGDVLSALQPLTPVLSTAVDLVGTAGGVLSSVAGPLEVVAGLLGDHPNLVLAAAAAWGAYKTVPKIIDKISPSVTRVGDAAKSGASSVSIFGSSLGEAYGYARQANTEIGRMGAAFQVVAGQGGVASAAMDGVRRAGGSLIDFFGGPWGVGLMAAGAIITGVVDANKRAEDAQLAMAQAARDSSAAQDELKVAVVGTTGALDEQGLTAAVRVANNELAAFVETGKSLDGWFAKTMSFDDMMGMNGQEISEYNAKINETGEAYKTLEQVAGSLGIPMDELNQVVAAGGPAYDSLVTSLRGSGDSGQLAAQNLESVRAKIEETVEAGRRLDPGMQAAADAVKVLADASSSAEDKLSALNTLLQQMGLAPKDAERAMRDASEAISEIAQKAATAADQSGALGDALFGLDGKLDTTTTNGRSLFDQMDQLGQTLQNVAVNGGDTQAKFEEMQPALQSLQDSFGLSDEKMQQLIQSFGLVPETLDMLVNLEGADTAEQEVMAIATGLKDVPDGKTVEVTTLSDEAKAQLEDLGLRVENLPNGNIGITIPDEDIANRLDTLGIKTETLPDGHIAISDTTDANMSRLQSLGIEVSRDKHGNVIISDNSASTAATVRANLDGLRTYGTHTQTYIQRVEYFQSVNPGMSAADAGRQQGPIPYSGRADGGVTYAANGRLSQKDAQVAKGGDWLVWAEDETEGESFIPHAQSKRRRSTQILAETANLFGLGLTDKFGNPVKRDNTSVAPLATSYMANGAVRGVDEIDAFARGLEGKPYVWGGVNWGDCSGAMSAIARFATGLDAFAGRFATGNMREALLGMGFSLGRGGDGDLRFGWFNGGPYGGHTAGTLPNGVNVEMGGGRGNGQYGGPAAGSNHSQFTDHAYIHVGKNYAALNAALQAGAGIEGKDFASTGVVILPGEANDLFSTGVAYAGSGTSGTSGKQSNAPKTWSDVAGRTASAWASGMVEDALDVFGLPDSPPFLDAYGQYVDGQNAVAEELVEEAKKNRTTNKVDDEKVAEIDRKLATAREDLRIKELKVKELKPEASESQRASATQGVDKQKQTIADLEKQLEEEKKGTVYKVNEDGTLGSKVKDQVATDLTPVQYARGTSPADFAGVYAGMMQAVVGNVPTASVPRAVKDPFNQMTRSLGVPLRLAMGGSVLGLGGPVADAIPALLSAGEHVTRTLVADQARPLLEKMNASPVFARALNDAVFAPPTASEKESGPTYIIQSSNVDEGIRKAEMMERRRLSAMGL